MSNIPDNLNWVNVRYRCTAGEMFRQLEDDVQRDVDQRNKLKDKITNRHSFTFQSEANQFAVVCDDSGPVRAFYLRDGRISVQNRQREELISASAALNDEGRCMLRVGAEQLERWQFLKRALEPFFFDLDLTDSAI